MTTNFIIDILKSKAFKEFLKYGLVGGVGLLIELSVFYLLVHIISVSYPFSGFISDQLRAIGVFVEPTTVNGSISHIISSVIAITNNFILNSYFTFKVTDKKLKRFLSFAGIASVGLIVSTSLFTFLVQHFSMNDMFAKIIATLFVAMLQFIINKLFTFKSSK